MLSSEDNELMCRVGQDTAMGQAIRRFWVPAIASYELPEPDCDPVHVELLGQNFVAFRDSNGQVGLLDEHCCHRGASLTVGRSENCGIRCIYHGWLFSRDGTVLETPNVPDPRFKERFKAKAYPVREEGGLIFAYLGPVEEQPPFPDFPWVGEKRELYMATCQIVASNYVQSLEGLLDSSHLSILHSSAISQMQGESSSFVSAVSHMQFDAAPRVESEETDFGVHYAAIRSIEDKAETRIAAFLAPFWVLNPNGDIWVAMVPMTDEKTAVYTVWWDGEKEFGTEPLASQQRRLIGHEPETLEAYGQTRKSYYGPNRMGRQNGFRQDRDMMRTGHFTGVPSLLLEDALVCSSAGPIRDRQIEKLASVDMAIAHFYRSLLNMAKQMRDGQAPSMPKLSVNRLRGVNRTLDPSVDWRTLVPDHYRVEHQALVAAE